MKKGRCQERLQCQGSFLPCQQHQSVALSSGSFCYLMHEDSEPKKDIYIYIFFKYIILAFLKAILLSMAVPQFLGTT